MRVDRRGSRAPGRWCRVGWLLVAATAICTPQPANAQFTCFLDSTKPAANRDPVGFSRVYTLNGQYTGKEIGDCKARVANINSAKESGANLQCSGAVLWVNDCPLSEKLKAFLATALGLKSEDDVNCFDRGTYYANPNLYGGNLLLKNCDAVVGALNVLSNTAVAPAATTTATTMPSGTQGTTQSADTTTAAASTCVDKQGCAELGVRGCAGPNYEAYRNDCPTTCYKASVALTCVPCLRWSAQQEGST